MMTISSNNRRQAMGLMRGLNRFMGLRARARFRRGEEGGALVEFAVVLPVMLMLITGIFAVGIAFNNQLTLTQAVGAGAQHLQTIRTGTSDPCADTFNAITAAAPNLTSSKISLSITINGGTPQTGNNCAGATSSLYSALNMPVTVSATYPCNLQIFGVSPVPGCKMAATVTEYEY
jgi:Flp pilus assembly protein TadG